MGKKNRDIYSGVRTLRKNTITPKLREIIIKLPTLDDPKSMIPEAIALLQASQKICCPYKVKHTMETAASCANPESLDIYICRVCGFIHFGHPSQLWAEVRKILAI